MFSGIVTGCDKIAEVTTREYGLRFGVNLGDRAGLEVGASVAINGVCLTAVEWDESMVYFDVIPQTLKLSNLGGLSVGSLVNTERSFRYGQELGGHIVSGHVDCVVTIARVSRAEGEVRVWYNVPEKFMKYIFDKGFVALDGCSLTIAGVADSMFEVCYIPETLEKTVHGRLDIGKQVNLEIDRNTQAVVDTVARIMEARK